MVQTGNDSNRTLLNITRLITQEKDRNRLVDEFIRIILDSKSYINVWVVLTDNRQPVEPYFHGGFDTGFESMARVLNKGIIPRCGIMSFESDAAQVISNPSHDCLQCPLAGQYNYRSGFTRRLGIHSHHMGWISISVPMEFSVNEDELEFFSDITDLLSYALENLTINIGFHLSGKDDIGGREQPGESLNEDEAYFKSIFDFINSGIVIYEPVEEGRNFIFKDMNPVGQMMSKVRLPEILGRKVTDVFPGVTDLGLLDCLQKACVSGESQYLPVKEYRDDRLSLVVENHISRLPSGNLLVIYDDKTDQFQLEKRIRQSEKMEAIGHLAGGIAHDFNNILTGILGYAELLKLKQAPDSSFYDYVENIVAAGDRAKTLVEQILSFSRQRPDRQEPFQLGPVVEEAVRFLRSTIPATVKIKCRLGNENGTVLGDSTKIYEILLNLSTNAAFAMNDKGTLEIELDEIDNISVLEGSLGKILPGKYSVLTVRDDGCGMTDEILDHAFEPFFTTGEVGEGTGLGLSVVFGIVRNHRGNLRIISKPGEGTEFNLYFPQLGVITEKAEEKNNSISGGDEHILIVDDEYVNCQLFKTLLGEIGYRISTFTDPGDALVYLSDSSGSVDLVVTDQTMPEMTGLELSQIINHDYSDIPVIICTGYSKDVNLQNFRDYGISDFLAKPVSFKDLSLSVRSVLNSKNK